MASNLPEIKNIIEHYTIGCIIDDHDPKHIAEKINYMLKSPDHKTWKENTKKAAFENTWENEKKHLSRIIETLN